MRLRFMTSLLCCLTLGVPGQTRAEDLKNIENRLAAQYEGKVVVVRVPDGKSVRLEVPKEERGKLAGQDEFLLRVEGLKLEKKEVEIEGRHIFPFQSKDGEILAVEWTARKYRLRWRKTPQSEWEWERTLAAVLTGVKEPPEWLALLPPHSPKRGSEEQGLARSKPSKEIGLRGFANSSDVTSPTCLSCSDAEYTDEARKANAEGMVVLHTLLDEDGRVRSMKFLRPLGHGMDERVMATVSRWRFRPALREGKPIRIFVVIEMNFYLH